MEKEVQSSSNPEKLKVDSQARKITRRSLLAGLGGIGATMAADQTLLYLSRHIPLSVRLEERSFDETSPSPELFRDTHATVIFTGFGVANAEGVARSLDRPLSRRGHIVPIQLPSSGLEYATIASELSRTLHKRGIESIDTYCQSMGSIIMANTFADAAMQEVLKGVRFENSFFDCSPFSVEDVRPARRSHLESLCDISQAPYKFGPIATSIGRTLDINSKVSELPGYISDSMNGRTCSFKLLKDQAWSLQNFDPKILRWVIPANTEVYYLHPEKPIDDDTVNSVTAIAHLKKALKRDVLGVHLVGSRRHACSVYNPDAYDRGFQAIENLELRKLSLAQALQKPRPLR